MREDDVTPRLGQQGKDGGAERYLNKVIKAAQRLALTKGGRKSFAGSRIGRGASKARAMAGKQRFSSLRSRQVIVKFRTIKLAGQGSAGAKAHLRYIERDGTGRSGEKGHLYSAQRDQANGPDFLRRSGNDRHQFRLIISPEDASQYPDLKSFTRRLMSQMEKDLGSKLDWVAVDHFNTAHPHTHVMLRGRSDRDTDLVIAPEYISHGVRSRAMGILNLDLGPRSDLEISQRLDKDIEAERLTSLDRAFLKEAKAHGVVHTRDEDPAMQTRRAGRLQKLSRLGLANSISGDAWRIDPKLADMLTKMGERGDIIRTMQRELAARNLTRPDQVIADVNQPSGEPIIGKIVGKGLSSEYHDRRYLLIDAVDGRVHYVDIGLARQDGDLPIDAIVAVEMRDQGPRSVDHNIVAVAKANEGRYTLEAHLRHDPSASEEYAKTHVRRLEAIRRRIPSLEREASGAWLIKADHLQKVTNFEEMGRRDQPVTIKLLSSLSVERLPTYEAATWLDQDLTSPDPLAVRDAGFGREVRQALLRRRQWLMAEGLGDFTSAHHRLSKEELATLRSREVGKEAAKISTAIGKSFRPLKTGDLAEGTYVRPVQLLSGKFALIENSKEFSLVPWRPVLERQVGKYISGMIREGGINWRFNRDRGGPSIS